MQITTKEKLVVATGNKNKLKEIAEIFVEFDVVSQKEMGFDVDVEETGVTFAENALIKARAAATIGMIGVGDDSGLTVDALGGEPGIYSARYSGGHGNDEDNNNLLIANLKPHSDKTAHYTAAVAVVYPDGREVCAEGYMYGRIIDTPRGDRGFGYDPIFIPEGEERTVAEMSDEEKNTISHRAMALKNLLLKL